MEQSHKVSRFLLARLHVDSLLDKRTKQKVLSTLDKLSKGSTTLDKAYGEALKRIDGQLPEDRSLATRALSWITHAQRLLTTTELCHALAIEPGDKSLNNDNVYDVEDVISFCAGLVTVDPKSNIIRLVHHTTQEFFERVCLEWNPGAQEEIAIACLTYLSFDTFRSGSCASDEAFEQRLAENAFFHYLAHYWSEHIRPVEKTASRLALAFVSDEALVDCTIQAVSTSGYKYEGYSRNFPNRTSGQHLTARYGLLYVTETLLMGKHGDGNIGADARDGYGRTPLWWAAEEGPEAMVRLLVERDDVNADSRDDFGRTPLSRAAARGHEAMVRLLVERDDVEADLKDDLGRTPLSRAAEGGYEVTVRLLVERDDVNADSKDDFGRTPLSRAAARGHEAVVRLLVERDDVEADSKDHGGRTPLWLATEGGHEATVRLLVKRDDAEVDLKGEGPATPDFDLFRLLNHRAIAIEETSQQIYDLSGKCNNLFGDVLSVLSRSDKHYQIVLGHRKQFEFWTEALGVFARLQVSLDSRLKFRPDIRDMVIQLLEVLKRHIQYGESLVMAW